MVYQPRGHLLGFLVLNGIHIRTYRCTFQGTSLEGCDDDSHTDYMIFKSIKEALDDILDSYSPLSNRLSNHSTVENRYADEGYDPF